MDQIKTGCFLKELRKQKGITQEKLAEKLNVSTRSVSRWETGSNMPDISLLVEIADYYDVDVREIIEGERKSERMDKEVREVATKMADYANAEKSKLLRSIQIISFVGVLVLFLSIVIQTAGKADKHPHHQDDVLFERAPARAFIIFIKEIDHQRRTDQRDTQPQPGAPVFVPDRQRDKL